MKTFKFWAQHKLSKECERNFIRNGRLLQEKLIAFLNGKNLPFHVYTYKEIIKFSNFNHKNLLQDQFYFKLYKGIMKEENRPICIKIYDTINQFIGVEGIFQEIVIASQMNMHSNSLKMLGCCLETDYPVIVYESPDQNCLEDYLYRLEGSLSWKIRLKIGSEISYALAYLQNCFNRPLIFRNLSSRDVFLDKDYIAKLTGFYFSVRIPEGEDHVMDAVIGTNGSRAPEYTTTGRLTEKTDVFAFRLLLFELLVGTARVWGSYYSYNLLEKVREHGDNIEIGMIVDPMISREIEESGNQQQLLEVFEVCLDCISKNEDDRPNMVDIANRLKKILDSSLDVGSYL